MKSVKLYLPLLLLSMSLAAARPCSAQTMTNTANTITLTGTCLSDSLSTGVYTLTLYYIDPDHGPTHIRPMSVSAVAGDNTITLTLPNSVLPTPATNGYFWLSDTDSGSILLSGPGSRILYWYHLPTGAIGFNCYPLSIQFTHNLF